MITVSGNHNTQMETSILPIQHPKALETALETLLHGGLVAFPTDTVYGLGALISDSQAIEQLFIVKGRDTAKAIAVLLGSPEALPKITATMSPEAQRLAERFWPGPLTLVVARHPALPENLSPLPTVGVRMPDHPAALALLNLAGPLAVTSANLSGAPNSQTAQDVFDQLGGLIPLILDGGSTPGGSPSTVVDCTTPEFNILRLGPITREQILAAL
jgi:L-threonylcarbamoyladenylate synthase